MASILLVEDDPLIYRLYQKLFTLEGFEFHLAENGQLGLEALSVMRPDIILLDVMMPVMNGLEMLVKVKETPEWQDIPIVILTNMSDMNVANMAMTRGALDCIIKSQTEPAEVVSVVTNILAKTAPQAAANIAPAPVAMPTTDAAAPAPNSVITPSAPTPPDTTTPQVG